MRFGIFTLTVVLICACGLSVFLLPSLAEADVIICELYDEGDKGEDQFVELCNPDEEPVDLSGFYLSVLTAPMGEGDEYGEWELTNYDYDRNGNELLDDDEFLVATDYELDLGLYAKIALFYKSNNSLADELAWSFAGPGPDPAQDMSAQLPYDNDNGRYVFDKWIIAPPTKANKNIVAVPNFENYSVVINEVNPEYVELYNTASSQIDLEGYKVAGHKNYYTIPTGTVLEPGSHYLIPNTLVEIDDKGGDMKLLTELGVLIDIVTWEPRDSWEEESYTARHIDGLGKVGYYLEETANQGFEDEPNLCWEFDVPSTEGERNYQGATILVDGIPELYQLYNSPGSGYEGGIVQEDIEKIQCLPSWDIILYGGRVREQEVDHLEDYLNIGGRLYLEPDGFDELESQHQELYEMLHYTRDGEDLETIDTVVVSSILGTGMSLGFNDSSPTANLLHSDPKAYTLLSLQDPKASLAIAYFQDNSTGYRVVTSSLHYRDLQAGEETPEDFMDALLGWFLEPELNHGPELTLLEGQADTTVLMNNNDYHKELKWLGWENNDPDHWDQQTWLTQDAYGHGMYRSIEFTLYLDQSRSKVESYHEDCLLVETTNTSFYLPEGLASGHYYWTVTATDKFDVAGAALDIKKQPVSFSFYFDNVTAELLSVRPYFKTSRGVDDVGEEMLGFYEEHGNYPSFGAAVVVEGLLFRVQDLDSGLSFTGGEDFQIGVELRFVSTTPGVLGGCIPYGDLPLLARNGSAASVLHGEATTEFILDLEGLELESSINFLDDDGNFRDGRYTVLWRVVDRAGNRVEDSLVFTIDHSAPDPVTGLYIEAVDNPIYENTGVKFLKAGESYKITGTGPTTASDGTLENLSFYTIKKLTNPSPILMDNFTAEELASAQDSKNYSVTFKVVAGYEFYYVISKDRAGNTAMSEILGGDGGIVVDAYSPTKPYDLSASSGVGAQVDITGWARDNLVAGKTSGMSHVLIYLNGDVVIHQSSGQYEWLDNQEYLAGDPVKNQVVANRFIATVSLEPISTKDGDLRNIIQVQGVDNVGNMGNLNDPDALPAIRLLDPKKSLNVAMKEEASNVSLGQDQLSAISITSLRFAIGDFDYHIISINYHDQAPDTPPSAMAMQGYWTVDCDAPGDFITRIRIEFNHPSISPFDFEKLHLVSRSTAKWQVLEDAVFIHQKANSGTGIPELWYVEATIQNFTELAIIQGMPDLQIVDSNISSNSAQRGQVLNISVTVRNVGELATAANGVKVRVYYRDWDGAESTINWIEFHEPLKPGKAHQMTGEVQWETPIVTFASLNFYVNFKVDPDNEVKEYNETNNHAFIDDDGDGLEDPVEILGLQSIRPLITTPQGHNTVVRGTVTIQAELSDLEAETSYQNHSHGIRMNIIEVNKPYPLIFLWYQLKDPAGNPVPGAEGRVVDVQGLSITDKGVDVAFNDLDGDERLTAGDSFVLKGPEQEGKASEGSTLELTPFAGPDWSIAVKPFKGEGNWEPLSTLNSTGPWDYEWNTTTVEDGKYSLTAHVEGDDSTYFTVTVTVDNVADSKDDNNEPFLEKKLGALPVFAYLLLFTLGLGALMMFFMRDLKKQESGERSSDSEELKETTGPNRKEDIPINTWHCFRCGKDISINRKNCSNCGNQRTSQLNSEVNS